MATLTEEKVIDIGQSEVLVTGSIALDSSYPTGGEAFDAPGDLGYHDLWITGTAAGYLATWDKTNQKLIAYQQSAATSALTQVPNATDLSAVAVRFCALRPK